MTQKQATDLLLTSPSARTSKMSNATGPPAPRTASAFSNSPWASSTIHLPNGEVSPATHAAIGPKAWDRFSIAAPEPTAADGASEVPTQTTTTTTTTTTTANDLYERMGLPHARMNTATTTNSDVLEDITGYGSFFLPGGHHGTSAGGWSCVQCGRSLRSATLEHGVYVCEAEGCGTVQVCTERISEGREKNCREDEDKTIHGDRPWQSKRPKHGMRNLVIEELGIGIGGDEKGGSYRNAQRVTERGSVQEALITMYGIHGPTVAKRNTAAHTSVEKVFQEYGSLVDRSVRERTLRIIDALSVNTAIHRMHCGRAEHRQCQLDIMSTPSKHLAMIALELALEQEVQELETNAGFGEQSSHRSESDCVDVLKYDASSPSIRLQGLAQLRARVKSAMQANCHGQSEIKLRLAATVARMVLVADDGGARLRMPCVAEDKPSHSAVVPALSKLDPETFDAPRAAQRRVETAGVKAAALVRRMKAHVATAEQRGEIHIPNAQRLRLSKLIRSSAVDEALQSIIHVPGVCDASPLAGTQDLAVVSEHVLVALLFDATNQGVERTSVTEEEASTKRVGWSPQAVEEARSPALKRATEAIAKAFAKAVELAN